MIDPKRIRVGDLLIPDPLYSAVEQPGLPVPCKVLAVGPERCQTGKLLTVRGHGGVQVKLDPAWFVGAIGR